MEGEAIELEVFEEVMRAHDEAREVGSGRGADGSGAGADADADAGGGGVGCWDVVGSDDHPPLRKLEVAEVEVGAEGGGGGADIGGGGGGT